MESSVIIQITLACMVLAVEIGLGFYLFHQLATNGKGLEYGKWLGKRILKPRYLILDEYEFLAKIIRKERTQTTPSVRISRLWSPSCS